MATAAAPCLPPWDDNDFSVTPHSGHFVDIKQTDGFTYEGGVLDDGPVQGALKIDVSNHGTMRDVRFTRNVVALVLNDQTPLGSLTTTYDIVAQGFSFGGNSTDLQINTPATPGHLTLTIQGRRDDGQPLETKPDPLPPGVVVLPAGD